MPITYKDRARVSRLTAGTLARFAGGLTWSAILDLDEVDECRAWWRTAIADAEDRGLLTWNAATKSWHLTDAGREHTRGIS